MDVKDFENIAKTVGLHVDGRTARLDSGDGAHAYILLLHAAGVNDRVDAIILSLQRGLLIRDGGEYATSDTRAARLAVWTAEDGWLVSGPDVVDRLGALITSLAGWAGVERSARLHADATARLADDMIANLTENA